MPPPGREDPRHPLSILRGPHWCWGTGTPEEPLPPEACPRQSLLERLGRRVSSMTLLEGMWLGGAAPQGLYTWVGCNSCQGSLKLPTSPWPGLAEGLGPQSSPGPPASPSRGRVIPAPVP